MAPGGEVGTVAFKTVSRPFSNHATECIGIVRGGNQRVSLQKCANFSGPICACAINTRIQPEYPVLFSMFNGEFCLRLKLYLVVKIAPDVLTEHYCQVCVLVMMFCHPDCRLCAGVARHGSGSTIHVQSPSRATHTAGGIERHTSASVSKSAQAQSEPSGGQFSIQYQQVLS